MASDAQSTLHELLALRGVTRRDFMKFCGSMAAMLGLSEIYAPTIASAVSSATAGGLTPAVWLNFGSCTGCTEAVAQVDSPDVASIVLDLLSVNYNETLMAAAGEAAEKAKADTIADGGYLLICEGSVMKGENGNTLRLAGRTGLEHLEEAAKDALAVVAIGSCAVDGGWVKAEPHDSDHATGVMEYLGEVGIDTPVVNLPTCPVNPEWVVAIVIDALLLGKVEDGSILDTLDDFNRPRFIFGQTIHDNCPRRGHFENNEFVTEFGSEEEALGYCLYKMGCKGPTTQTNCPIVRWNRRASWCVESGSPCIGCGSLDWVDNNAPFLSRMANVGTKLDPETIGLVAGGAALAGLVAHGVVQTATGRMGKGAPTEDKGGDE
ncbi:MAG: hydrogenase small subunit [Coriobacteriia bacterium]